ncbi:MAG: hypothetical protein OXH79_20365 [Boseongicola sp.]|nr:hypothetical protein [Boseongicola sp.]
MIVAAFLLLGVALGLRAARKRRGALIDMLRYAVVYGIAFALLGVFLSLGIGSAWQ